MQHHQQLSGSQLGALIRYAYTGIVGETLLTGASAPVAVLDSDMQALVALLQGARVIGAGEISRCVQRSIVSRIGKGPPTGADGFNADLELLARTILVCSQEFDADYKLILGFFVHGNFSPLLQYFQERSSGSSNGFPGTDKAAFTYALCGILPVDPKVKVARPSRWLHWDVAPMSEEYRTQMGALVNTVKTDKLANWFVWPVSAIDFNDPTNRKSTIPDYWGACQFPMHLEGVSDRLNANYYVSPDECINDLRLVFCNAMKYNDESR